MNFSLNTVIFFFFFFFKQKTAYEIDCDWSSDVCSSDLFEPPISPHIAAKEAQIEVDIGTIRRNFELLAAEADWVVIEGAGGWFAPISERQTDRKSVV